MATRFSGIGDNLVEDSRNQEHDNTVKANLKKRTLSSKYLVKQPISDNS